MHLDHHLDPPVAATDPAGALPVIDRVAAPGHGWVVVCPTDRIAADTGVAAWVTGQQVAVFRLADGSLHALDNRDPASGADVLARGILGDSGGRPVVASPVYKQRFDLVTGACLDDPSLEVGSWEVRVVDGQVAVRPPAACDRAEPSS